MYSISPFPTHLSNINICTYKCKKCYFLLFKFNIIIHRKFILLYVKIYIVLQWKHVIFTAYFKNSLMIFDPSNKSHVIITINYIDFQNLNKFFISKYHIYKHYSCPCIFYAYHTFERKLAQRIKIYLFFIIMT